MITLVTECPFCGNLSEVEVSAEDYEKYCAGELAQNAFPYLSPEEREVIISGMCVKCQKEFFG